MLDNVVRFPSRATSQAVSTMAMLGDWSWHWTMPVKETKGLKMAPNQMQLEADAIAADLVSGQLQTHARRFSYPLLVYIGDKIMILNNEIQLLEALGLYRSILSEERLSLITSTVTDCDCDTNGSCKISVRNRYFATDGRDLGTARVNYYGEGSGANRKIRMVEYLEWPCPDRVAECLPLQLMMA